MRSVNDAFHFTNQFKILPLNWTLHDQIEDLQVLQSSFLSLQQFQTFY